MMICKCVTFLLLLSYNISGATNETKEYCLINLKVPRHTVFKAHIMTEQKINCPVTHHGCQGIPIISWCKIYGDQCKALIYSDVLITEWKNTAEHEGMAFLVFQNISMEDAGLYRCSEGDKSVSHSINVSVTDKEDEFMSLFTSCNTSLGDLNTLQNDDQPWLWTFVYICTGIALMLFIVSTPFLLYFVRCQGSESRRKYKNQDIETQSKDLLLHLNPNLLTSVVYRG